MITKKVNRYYCEFCRKGGQVKHCIQKHENGCTANPNRACGMCLHAGLTQRPMAELTKPVAEGKWGIEELHKATEGCPACMLAAIRQSGINKDASYEEPGLWFDFKAAAADWWTQQANDRAVEHDSIYIPR